MPCKEETPPIQASPGLTNIPKASQPKCGEHSFTHGSQESGERTQLLPDDAGALRHDKRWMLWGIILYYQHNLYTWNKGDVIQWLMFVHPPGSPLVLTSSRKSSPTCHDLPAHREIAKGSLRVIIKSKIPANPISTEHNLKIKPSDEAHWRIYLVMHSWLLSDVKQRLVSSVPGEAAQQVCHGAVPLEWRLHCCSCILILFFHSVGAVAAQRMRER